MKIIIGWFINFSCFGYGSRYAIICWFINSVKDKVDINVVFSHPEYGATPYIKDVPRNVKKAIVFHDGQVTDVTAKAKTVDSFIAKSAPKAIVQEAQVQKFIT